MSTRREQGGMGPAGYVTIFIVILYLGFEVYGLERARERMEPAAVYAEYVGAHRAAALCDPEPPTRAAFERNFAAVTERARADLATRTSDGVDYTDSAVDATLRANRRARESEIDALIAADGCDGKQAWRLLKLYEIRSRLNLRPSGGGAAASIN